MTRVSLTAAAVVLATVAALVFPLASPSQTNNTWSGTWNTTYGTMTLTQTGSEVEGNYAFESGHVKGTVSGNVFSGRWDEAPRATDHDKGPFQFTMSGDGQSFTGTWGHDDTGPYPDAWNGSCTSGACKQNGTAPPPPSRCPGGNTAIFAQTTGPLICNTDEPAPGGSTTVSSPTLALGDKKVTVGVGSSAGNLSGTTIVGEAEAKRRRAEKIGEAVAGCWLIGVETIEVSPDDFVAALELVQKQHGLEGGFRGAFAVMDSPSLRLKLCIALATKATSSQQAQTAAGCNARRITFSPRIRRRKIVGLKLTKRQRPPRGAVRYKCTTGPAGTVSITARRRKGLRKAVGKKLDLGVVRARNARARQATLTFGFF